MAVSGPQYTGGNNPWGASGFQMAPFIDPDIKAQMGLMPGVWNPTGTPFQQQQIDLQRDAFRQDDARRQQMLNLLGLTPQLEQAGGLLGTNFFSSILGGTPADLVGGVTGAAAGSGLFSGPLFGGGGGDLSGGGGGDLFSQLLGARRAEGADIMGQLDGFGESQRRRIDEDFGALGGTQQARMEARGLGASSLAPAASTAVERGRQQARLDLEDSLTAQRVGTQMQLGEGLFGDVGAELQRGLGRQQIGAGLAGQLINLLGGIF
jgi:hypothetical protein